MYIDIIACYFVTSIVEKLYTKNKSEYKKNLLYFKQGCTNKNHRNKLYEKIFLTCKETTPTLTYKEFLQSCIDDLFTEFEIPEASNFSIFDRIMQNTVKEWIDYLLIYELDNIINKEVDRIETRVKFIYYLSIAVNEIIIAFDNPDEVKHSTKHYKQLIEYVKFLDKKKKITKDAETQTEI